MDTIRLSELLVYKKVFYRFSILTKLKNGKVYKALCGNPKENNEIRESHHVFQNSQQRLDEIYNSLQNTKYPSENKYIILYGDSNLIWDGQHRASCLLYMYGDIEVPVKRLYFFDTKKSKKEYFKFFIKKNVSLKKIYRLIIKVNDKIRSCKKKYYIKQNKETILEVFEEYYNEKTLQ